MAEKMDLKTFYEATQPTPENITALFYDLFKYRIGDTKQGFLESSNKAFAMLAHLRAYTLDKDESYRIQHMYSLITCFSKVVNHNEYTNTSVLFSCYAEEMRYFCYICKKLVILI